MGLAATLICGIGVLMSCSTDDNPVVEPTTEVLRDGVWTGSGGHEVEPQL